MSRFEQRGTNIFDNETNNERWDYVRLLNQQDEKIKELEKENKKLEKMVEIKSYIDQNDIAIHSLLKLKNELRERCIKVQDDTHYYLQSAVHWQDIVAILDKAREEIEEEKKDAT